MLFDLGKTWPYHIVTGTLLIFILILRCVYPVSQQGQFRDVNLRIILGDPPKFRWFFVVGVVRLLNLGKS